MLRRGLGLAVDEDAAQRHGQEQQEEGEEMG